MEPVMKSVCEERHEKIDERCEMHHDQIDALFKKIDCIVKNQGRLQWLIIGAIVAVIADIIRGMVVLDNVLKVAGK